jgi:hypothetical protein
MAMDFYIDFSCNDSMQYYLLDQVAIGGFPSTIDQLQHNQYSDLGVDRRSANKVR